jgi:hypothetical protein
MANKLAIRKSIMRILSPQPIAHTLLGASQKTTSGALSFSPPQYQPISKSHSTDGVDFVTKQEKRTRNDASNNLPLL